MQTTHIIFVHKIWSSSVEDLLASIIQINRNAENPSFEDQLFDLVQQCLTSDVRIRKHEFDLYFDSNFALHLKSTEPIQLDTKKLKKLFANPNLCLYQVSNIGCVIIVKNLLTNKDYQIPARSSSQFYNNFLRYCPAGSDMYYMLRPNTFEFRKAILLDQMDSFPNIEKKISRLQTNN